MRANVVLDDDLIDEAVRLTGLQAERDSRRVALQALIRQRSKRKLTDVAGQVRFADDFDPKATREPRDGAR